MLQDTKQQQGDDARVGQACGGSAPMAPGSSASTRMPSRPTTAGTAGCVGIRKADEH